MNSVIIKHKNGWSCTKTSEIKMEVYKIDGHFKKRHIAILSHIFNTQGKIDSGENVDILVRDSETKKYYNANVITITKSGVIKIHLVSGGTEDGYHEVLKTIKGGN